MKTEQEFYAQLKVGDRVQVVPKGAWSRVLCTDPLSISRGRLPHQHWEPPPHWLHEIYRLSANGPPAPPRQELLPSRPPPPPVVRTGTAAVYRCYNAANLLLYVGYSHNPPARLRAHASQSHWWTQVHRRTLEWFPTHAAAAAAEHQAILIECPIYNKAGQTHHYQRPT